MLNERKKINLFIIFRSDDGRILIASSTDGYCSIIHFQKGELGQEYKKQSDIPIKSDSINKTLKSWKEVLNIENKKIFDISYYKSKKKREKNSHYHSKKPAENAKSFDCL